MSKDIRINEPGDGDWIMERCEGVFRPGLDHSIANHRGGAIVGGFVLSQYLGASIAVHMAGGDPRWCSRDLMWMVFHYGFVQLGCHKMLAPVASDNYRALELDLRAGWTIETVVRDAYAPDRHLLVLGMTPDLCRWLRIIPQQYSPGDSGGKVP